MSDWQDNASTEQLEIVLEGERANAFLNSMEFKNAYNSVQSAIFSAWKTSTPDDKELRERLYLQITGMEAIKVQLTHLANKGKTTQQRLKRRQADG